MALVQRTTLSFCCCCCKQLQLGELFSIHFSVAATQVQSKKCIKCDIRECGWRIVFNGSAPWLASQKVNQSTYQKLARWNHRMRFHFCRTTAAVVSNALKQFAQTHTRTHLSKQFPTESMFDRWILDAFRMCRSLKWSFSTVYFLPAIPKPPPSITPGTARKERAFLFPHLAQSKLTLVGVKWDRFLLLLLVAL